ncbi:hypothetical protein [Legionella spiritensis]|uniref:hypothetical protein n=1 Tax=Legionella spiritensis TaxID=452 RepID=UPI000F6ECAB1|nr:hypothetical protein [Legionella spiritensis]VEG90334.1 Uncharacterised protein [Legionella spiritensis]
MSTNKWAKFHSTHSHLRIDRPTLALEEGSTNIASDWNRAANSTADKSQPVSVLIAGKPLSDFSEQYNNFADTEDVKKFFQEVILEKMKKPVKNEDAIINYLLKTLHQGGLLYPVTSSLSVALERDATKSEIESRAHYVNYESKKVSEATVGQTNQIINFIPTVEGFKVQEYVEVQDIIVNEHAFDKFGVPYEIATFPNGDTTIDATEGNSIKNTDGKPVIQAQGEVIVDCLSEEPKLSIGYNSISYNEPRIEKAMDKRSLLEIMVDYVKRKLGFNKVEAIEESKAEAEEEKYQTPSSSM